MRQLKARISKLQNWLKEETENTEPPTLADYIQDILRRKAQAGTAGTATAQGAGYGTLRNKRRDSLRLPRRPA